MIDLDKFEERAAIMEFDGGLSRFQAETRAAQAQGRQRKEVLDEIGRRNSARARDQREAHLGNDNDALPRVQRASEEEARPVSQRDVQA
jgi:hypothetical protein